MGKLIVLFIVCFSLGCAQGNCRRKEKIPEYPGASLPGFQDEASEKRNVKGQRVLVFKYDDSKQCSVNKGKTLQEMAQELSGVQIFSSKKKPDGLMHIQVCGSSTGMTNVYEILASDLKKAEDRGFQQWKFN